MSYSRKVGVRFAFGLLLVVAVMALAIPAAAQAAPAGDTITYTVKPGDRLVDIAARYGVSASAIVRANGLANADVIYPGQRLVIPTAGGSNSGSTGGSNSGGSTGTTGGSSSTGGTSSSAGTYYTVKLGDTLDKIARATGVSSAAIIKANGISNPDMIYVGQRLYIPGGSGSTGGAPAPTPKPSAPKPSTGGQTIYTVKPGDTLGQIAQRYGTTVAALVAANGLGNPNSLRIGMRLVIPKSGGAGPTYPGQATSFVVSISAQRCTLYRGSAVIAKWVCSTGRSGSGTRPGTYRIQSKLPKAYGSTWNIWMPYWLGIYWAGASENGIHGLPWNAKTGVQIWSGYIGTPITYGCVMLDNVNAKMLYDMAYIGMPVTIKP